MKGEISRRDLIKLGGKALASAGAGGLVLPLKAAAGLDPESLYNLPEGGIENSRKIIRSPCSIVSDGRLNLGVFDAPPREMNLSDALLFSRKPKGWIRRNRLQEFIGYSIEHHDWHIGIINIDIQFLNIAGLYALNLKTHETYQYEYWGRGKNFRLARTTWEDSSYAKKQGFRIEFDHRLDEGFHRIKADVDAGRKKPAVSMDVTFHEDLNKIQPLVVSLPVEPRHYFYTQKVPAPVEGFIKIGDEKVELDPARCAGTMDEHRNFYPIPNRWFFGCLSRHDKKGRLVSVNMCDNIIKDQDHWNENCMWVDGKISLLGPIGFDIDRKNIDRPWMMTEKHGRLELEMLPEGGNEVTNIPPLGFRYFQKCGPYRGHLVDDNNEKHIIEDYFGEAEIFELGFF